MHGALPAMSEIKSISAVKPPRPSGYQQRKKRANGANHLRWKRMTATLRGAVEALQGCPPDRLDELVKVVAAEKRLNTPVTRLVYVEHLNVTQGAAARRYADVIRKFERFHMASSSRSARSANLEPSRNVEDQELGRITANGRLREYEAAAKVAKREYKKLMKVVDRFADPVTGRNYAKDQLDNLCIFEREPMSGDRLAIGAVLTMIAKEFGLEEHR